MYFPPLAARAFFQMIPSLFLKQRDQTNGSHIESKQFHDKWDVCAQQLFGSDQCVRYGFCFGALLSHGCFELLQTLLHLDRFLLESLRHTRRGADDI
jgi:hypothetical protein